MHRSQRGGAAGGAPVTKAFAETIGADGFAADAGSAAKLAKSFIK
ncbi:MAG: hypothetical protein RQ739_07720 [Desulfotignum sp.]|nr:hypothetical protein [Desulfotignum sp.]